MNNTTNTTADLSAARDAARDAYAAARAATLAASDALYATMQARSYAAYLDFHAADVAYFDHLNAQNGN